MDRDLHIKIESVAKKAIDICPLVKTKRDRSVAEGVMKLFEMMLDTEFGEKITEKPVETVTSGYVKVEEITETEAEKAVSKTISADSGDGEQHFKRGVRANLVVNNDNFEPVSNSVRTNRPRKKK